MLLWVILISILPVHTEGRVFKSYDECMQARTALVERMQEMSEDNREEINISRCEPVRVNPLPRTVFLRDEWDHGCPEVEHDLYIEGGGDA